MRPYAFGADVGGTTVKLGLFQTDGMLFEKWQIDTRTTDNGRHVLPDVLRSVSAVMEHHALQWEQIEGLGMGVPGPVSDTGTVFRCVNLGWDIFNVTEKLRELEPKLKKVRVSNDVNAATLGELWQGAAKGRKSVFMVTLGTGVGGGLVINERIISGADGSAGEIGHVCINPREPELCSCGKRGCLEQYCSARGLVRCTKRTLRCNPKLLTVLRNDESLTAKSICDAARDGDHFAGEMLNQLADWLGWALTFAAGTADPEVIVIGGGLSQAGDILLTRIRHFYQKYAFHAFRDTAFVLAELGNDAGIYGCVRMLL